MAIGTLAAIIEKIRTLTGSANDYELTNAKIIDYINSFYLYDFPAQFRSLKLLDKFTFNTVRGIDVYPFDSEHYSTLQMPCYCSKREIQLFNDPWSFFGANFNWQYQNFFTVGDGSVGPYAGFTTARPLIRSVWNNPMAKTPLSPTSPYFPTPPQLGVNPAPDFTDSSIPGRVQNILITVNIAYGSTLNVSDDGNGNLIGDCTAGTINYETGQIAGLVFTANVPQGMQIQIQYNPTTLSIPLSVLFFQNQLTLRPVPDRGYTIEMMAYRLPSQALMGTVNPDSPRLNGQPELIEWWETIAFGASKKIYQDRLDPDGIALMDYNLNQAYLLNETRTYAQIGSQSMSTIFRDQLTGGYNNTGWGFGAGSN